ncbi:MAG TPA: serine hydrolase [Chryseolinea sp.]|nr:serine hydrolase [Chryseolinea sp.]HPM30043.1 serine hydrolase [Chryseolinea sp.]
MKKFIKLFFILIASILVVALIYVGITFPPVMAGMVSKTVCSCVFVAGRTVESVKEKELQVFPGLSSAGIEMNAVDSTVIATVLWTKSKAIFRSGLGCTLLAERSEEEVRNQQFNLAAPSVLNQDSILWPDGNRMPDSLLKNVKYDAINKALAEAFIDIDPKKPSNTLGVVVLYDKQIVGEKYAEGIDQRSKLMGWSMTKSVTSALIGILVKEGKLKTEDPAPVSEWSDDDRKQITLNNLLQASSGLEWSESYFVPTSDFHNMFIKSDDKGKYAANRKLKSSPNTVFQYSSGTSNILSRMIRQQVGDETYHAFPYEKLFYKIGMNNTIMEPDASGTFVGSSYTYATARDWARFGLLFLNDGVWNTERILPVGWVKYTTTPATTAPIGEYGAQWWLNVGAKSNSSIRKYPELPTDAYWADGFEEQFVMVIPSKKLVIVRLGVSHHGFDFTKMALAIIGALPQ